MANDPYNNKSLDQVDEEDIPELPEAVELAGSEMPVLEKGRFCPACKKEARIVSNSSGVSGHCVGCRTSWPLSSAALRPPMPIATPRGLRKETRVEPDWNMAFDDIGGGSDPTRK